MQNFKYTALDDFEIITYGEVHAESLKDAKKKLESKNRDNIPFEVWSLSEDINAERCNWLGTNLFYLHKYNESKLVYSAPHSYIVIRCICSLLIILAVIQMEVILGLAVVLFFLLTFFRSISLCVYHNSIVYKKRFFHQIQEKHIDISNAEKVIVKGIKFVNESGKFKCYFFVSLLKNNREVVVLSNSFSIKSAIKAGKRIGNFLNLPVEVNRSETESCIFNRN
jgi:hypothetical protein